VLLDDNIAAVRAAIPKMQAPSAGSDDLFNQLIAQAQARQAAPAADPSMPSGAGGQHGAAISRAMPGLGGPPQHLAQPTGNLNQWIGQALGTLHLDNSYAAGIANIAKHESGGDPNNYNPNDSNGQGGKQTVAGLMQMLQSTFDAHSLPGHTNIRNPVDNIISAVRYARDRYGDAMVKGGGRRFANGSYKGY
jgi:hypothetical protein